MTPHDAFLHSRRSLFLGLRDRMGMFTVYCDDSGTDKNCRIAAVSGFISNVGQWELFNQEWTQIRKAFGVDQMHRADLESFKGEFLESRGWGPRRRTAILKKLHSIMKRRAKVAIRSSVIRKDFDDIVPPPVKKLFGGVYGWCAHECIVLAKVWAEKCQRGPMPPFQWIFEAGTTGYGQVDEMLNNLYATPETRALWRKGACLFKARRSCLFRRLM